MKGTLSISAAVLGLGSVLAFTVPAHAVPWGQGDYYGRQHGTNCNCAAEQQQQTAAPAQQGPSTIAKQNRPAGLPDNGNGSDRLQR